MIVLLVARPLAGAQLRVRAERARHRRAALPGRADRAIARARRCPRGSRCWSPCRSRRSSPASRCCCCSIRRCRSTASSRTCSPSRRRRSRRCSGSSRACSRPSRRRWRCPVAWLAWVPASWIAAVATFTAGLPGARSPVADRTARRRAADRGRLGGASCWSSAPARPRRARGAAVVLVVAVIAYGGDARAERASSPTWAARPTGSSRSATSGRATRPWCADAGQVALDRHRTRARARWRPASTQLGIDRIQLLVLTHYDLDHVGGVDAVRRPGRPGADRAAVRRRRRRAIADALAGARCRRRPGRARRARNARRARLAGALAAAARASSPATPASVDARGDAGAGCACLSGLFLGDLGEESQVRLLGADPPGHVDVVKVAHHGSADQAAALYESVRRDGRADRRRGRQRLRAPDRRRCSACWPRSARRRTARDLDGLILVAPGDGPASCGVWTARARAGVSCPARSLGRDGRTAMAAPARRGPRRRRSRSRS